jgi:hypothetical protein
MTHNIYDLIEKISKIKKEEVKQEQMEVLNELYGLVDEYNDFIRNMDIKFDKAIHKLEGMIEHGN